MNINHITVAKFGGTSMKNKEAMERSATIAIKHKARFCVVSATSGTTNSLLEIVSKSKKGDIESSKKIVQDLKNKHLQIAEELNLSPEGLSAINIILEELLHLVQGIYFLKEVSPKASDRLQSIGERVSSILFSKALENQLNHNNFQSLVETLDARLFLKTDSNFTKAKPDIEQIRLSCEPLKQQILNSPNQFYVTQGFIGSNKDGHTTTLGRGGSDYSASIFGEALDANEIQIWTDVPGIATTDPRICNDAKIIPELSFKEAAEMATFGAKILHPTTVLPAKRGNIPVFVGSSYDPDQPGTKIKQSVDDKPLVRSINLRKDQTLITISNPRMLNAHGFLANIFETFKRHDVSVDAITTSEISVAMTVNTLDLEDKNILHELEVFGKVSKEDQLSIVSIIGNKINHTSGLANSIFQALGDINVRMICQGASLHNFCFLVKEEEGPLAVSSLHNAFITKVN